jgi:multidrug efflux pump subunit AcrB
MTTATTVLGLLPMALGLGDGAEIRTPMALTVICGLATSTVLTLIVIPVIYHGVMSLREKQIGPAAASENLDSGSLLAK